MTVGELKTKLLGISDDIEVVIMLPNRIEQPCDYMAYVEEARFSPRSSISNEEFEIKAGRTYCY